MAASDNVPSILRFIKQGDVARNRANSETVNNKLAGTMNALIDGGYHDASFHFEDYFFNNDYSTGRQIYRVTRDSEIIEYYMALRDSGSSANSIVNAAVYDFLGVSKGDLFGSGANRLLLSGSNGTNVVIGKTIEGDVDFDTNAGGHTIQYGVLNFTALDAGDIIVPYIEDNGTSARSLTFNLKLAGAS